MDERLGGAEPDGAAVEVGVDLLRFGSPNRVDRPAAGRMTAKGPMSRASPSIPRLLRRRRRRAVGGGGVGIGRAGLEDDLGVRIRHRGEQVAGLPVDQADLDRLLEELIDRLDDLREQPQELEAVERGVEGDDLAARLALDQRLQAADRSDRAFILLAADQERRQPRDQRLEGAIEANPDRNPRPARPGSRRRGR